MIEIKRIVEFGEFMDNTFKDFDMPKYTLDSLRETAKQIDEYIEKNILNHFIHIGYRTMYVTNFNRIDSVHGIKMGINFATFHGYCVYSTLVNKSVVSNMMEQISFTDFPNIEIVDGDYFFNRLDETIDGFKTIVNNLYLKSNMKYEAINDSDNNK
jgi:hypothetical protein